MYIYIYMSIPKYQKIVDTLRQKIISGEYKPGDKLPGFVTLAREFNVSNITSNRALIELENMGLVQRREREGTFVAQQHLIFDRVLVVSSNPIADNHPQIMGYWQGIIEAGNEHDVSIELISPTSVDFLSGKILEQTNPKGVIFLMELNPSYIEVAQSYKKPYVVLGVEDDSFICVLEDRYNAANQLARIMVRDGYRKIGFVGNLLASNHRLARDGYIEGIRSLNLGYRFVRDANEANVKIMVNELIDDGVDALIIMGGYLPIVAFPVILESNRKIALGFLTENSAVLRFKGNAYIAHYSQTETAKLAFDILKKIFTGDLAENTEKIFHPSFDIYRPVSE